MTSLLIGLLALGAATVIGVLALAGEVRPNRTTQALASIDAFYSRGSTVPQRAAFEVVPLPPLLDRLRALAARLSPAGALGRLQRRLDLAGNPGSWTPERILAYKGAGLFGLGLLGALTGLHHGALVLLATGVGGAAGFFLPDVLVYNAGLKWQQKLQQGMPDALDLLTVCVEAGLGFDAALSQVARKTEGPMAAECARVLQEMQFGKSRVEALHALSERTTVPELRAFVSALVQASQLGIPVASVLREQAKEMRVRRRQRAEEQAQKVPVKILFPLIFCLFPALFVIVIGPGAISVYQSLFHQ